MLVGVPWYTKSSRLLLPRLNRNRAYQHTSSVISKLLPPAARILSLKSIFARRTPKLPGGSIE